MRTSLLSLAVLAALASGCKTTEERVRDRELDARMRMSVAEMAADPEYRSYELTLPVKRWYEVCAFNNQHNLIEIEEETDVTVARKRAEDFCKTMVPDFEAAQKKHRARLEEQKRVDNLVK